MSLVSSADNGGVPNIGDRATFGKGGRLQIRDVLYGEDRSRNPAFGACDHRMACMADQDHRPTLGYAAFALVMGLPGGRSG